MKKVFLTAIIIIALLSICCLGGITVSYAETEYKATIVNDDSFETVIVADAVVTDSKFGADKTGVLDSTQAVKDAIAYVAGLGGGTVYFPKGKYRITQSITVDNYVTLMGNYVDPDTVTDGDYGTVIIADVAPSTETLPALFRLRGSTGVVGMTIFYPQQCMDDIRAFPYTFEIMGGAYTILEHMQFTIQNVTLLNAYRGVAASRTVNPNIQVGVQDAHEGLVIENLKGTVLKCGIDAVNESDVGYVKNVKFSPSYWANAVGYNNPSETTIRNYTYKNGCGLMLGDLEWSPYYDISVSGFKTGIHIIKGTRIQEENPIAFMGGFYRLRVADCQYGLVVDDLYKGWGMLVTHSTISGDSASVVNNAPKGYVRLTDTLLAGDVYGERIFSNTAEAPETVTQTPTLYRPNKNLYNVVADYGAVADGYTNCTTQIKSALSDAAMNGGGIVYLPAGYYKVTQQLVIPEGVQLRGCMSVTNRDNLGKSGGSIIFSYVDSDSSSAESDTAFITLSQNAGAYGFRVCYPENNLWKTTATTYSIKKTAFTIRALGDNSYVMNVGLINSYNGISVKGDNVVVKNLPSLFFNYGILVEGGDNCHIENVISNATVATQIGLHSKFTDLFGNGWLWRVTSLWNYYTYTETHTKMVTVSSSQNVNVMSTFTFCSARILSATDSTVTLNGCGADRMWQDGIVVDSTRSTVTLINQLKYNCMMFNMDIQSHLNIYGRMNLVLGNSPAVNDVEYNMVNNANVTDSAVRVAGSSISVTYPEDESLQTIPSSRNPLNDILKGLK